MSEHREEQKDGQTRTFDPASIHLGWWELPIVRTPEGLGQRSSASDRFSCRNKANGDRGRWKHAGSRTFYAARVELRVRPRVGRDALDTATAMLRQFRLVHSTAGMWEAADLHWWWRRPRRSDTMDQLFWAGANGRDIAATLLTDWGEHWGLDPIVVPGAEEALAQIWPAALALLPDLPGAPDVHMYIVDDDEELIGLATAAGFTPHSDRGASCWMPVDRRPGNDRLPSGYRLCDRVTDSARPHPMITRNGAQVAERLAATGLYRPELDLCVRDERGAVAAYGLFWFDPVTAVGHVEPMRTEDAHQGRGLARCVLAEGLDRLAALGAHRLKVNHELGNPAAAQLYRSAGFERVSTHTGFVRHARPD